MGERHVDIGLLIELIQQEPHIYDKANRLFRDDVMKQRTFEKVGRVLNITGEECRKYWKNLRDRYVREKKKMRVTHSGQEYDDYSLWPYVKPLGFLEPYIRPRSTYTATKAATSCAATASPSSPSISTQRQELLMETEIADDDTITFEIGNDFLQEPEESQEREESPEPEESQVVERYSQPSMSTPTFAAVGETPNKKAKRNGNGNKVANELVETARQIAAQIKPARATTNSFFGQYVAERLQEMPAEQRSAKRRAIVLLLENE